MMMDKAMSEMGSKEALEEIEEFLNCVGEI